MHGKHRDAGLTDSAIEYQCALPKPTRSPILLAAPMRYSLSRLLSYNLYFTRYIFGIGSGGKLRHLSAGASPPSRARADGKPGPLKRVVRRHPRAPSREPPRLESILHEMTARDFDARARSMEMPMPPRFPAQRVSQTMVRQFPRKRCRWQQHTDRLSRRQLQMQGRKFGCHPTRSHH